MATPVTAKTPDVAQLVEAARAGSPEALGALYARCGPPLFRLAYRLMGTREDAEDVVHDVFVGLPEALRHYDERGTLEGWLNRVTARVALMRLRRRAARHEVALNESMERASNADPTADRVALRSALDRLPDSLRLVVVLKEIEGYSHADVATLLGISPGTSRARLWSSATGFARAVPPASA